jgi:hypothetical protein
MKIQKRGISDIITTVLIILLAIAAVVLIWGFIKRPIEQGGQQIQASGDCFALKLKPTGCTIVQNGSSKNVSATIQWAEGNVNLKAIKFVVTDAKGATKVEDIDATGLKILETKSATINLGSLDNSSLTLSAVGVIQPKNGEPTPCTTSQTETLACS